jgi:hypothetical protein
MARGAAAARVAAAALLLCAACAAAVPTPVVLAPLSLRVSAAPWSLAAFDLPAGADVSVTLRAAVSPGATVASGVATADGAGAATLALALAAGPAPAPGLYTLRAASTAAGWTQSANVTLMGTSPLLVRLPPAHAPKPKPLRSPLGARC